MSRYSVLAYLDAGTGSMVLQLLAGGLVGVLAFVKFRWHSVKGWFQRSNKSES